MVSLRPIYEWLRDDALEQLSKLSQLLHSMFVGSSKVLKDNVSLIDPILAVIISTLRISQERKIFQPHFHLSIEALFQLCQTIDSEMEDTISRSTVCLGLTTILMSTPPPVRSQMVFCFLIYRIGFMSYVDFFFSFYNFRTYSTWANF